MVEKLISFSLKNRVVVLLVSACLFGWGGICKQNPLMPFLIYQKIRLLFSEWMGRSPQVIEDQVTYPLVSFTESENQEYPASSMFGMSFIYIILKIR
jgi:Cu(I)/Ag(I) efflux system membrane protein CusA/SilA